MTAKYTAPRSSGPVAQFPERPRRNDMQNFLYLSLPGHATALNRFLGSPNTTLVIGEMPVGWSANRQEGLLYPDLMVAFNVDRAAVIEDRGFAIDDIGKPPDFVLEVASFSTALNDYTTKRNGYAVYGIPEYWRFDPTGGRRYPWPLAGDLLIEGEYRPITITQTDKDEHWGHSDALNLDICWEQGQLRWYDPDSKSYLPTHEDALDAIIAAEAQRDAEREARIAAEARVRQLEQELRRRPL